MSLVACVPPPRAELGIHWVYVSDIHFKAACNDGRIVGDIYMSGSWIASASNRSVNPYDYIGIEYEKKDEAARAVEMFAVANNLCLMHTN